MTRMECLSIVNTHADLYYNGSLAGKGVFPVLLFFKSPVTNDVECRQGFFVEGPEASLWAEGLTKFYQNKDIPYILYLNGQLENSYGTLFGEVFGK